MRVIPRKWCDGLAHWSLLQHYILQGCMGARRDLPRLIFCSHCWRNVATCSSGHPWQWSDLSWALDVPWVYSSLYLELPGWSSDHSEHSLGPGGNCDFIELGNSHRQFIPVLYQAAERTKKSPNTYVQLLSTYSLLREPLILAWQYLSQGGKLKGDFPTSGPTRLSESPSKDQ